MAKLSSLLPFACCMIFFLNAALVGARPAPSVYMDNGAYALFVFGDSFADTGNLPRSHLSEASREWYYPYGSSWGNNKPTGRFSNALVESDLIAQMLGRHEAPPTYKRRGSYVHPHGMNFAAGGAGVFSVPTGAPTLDKQVDHFRDLVQDGTITRGNLENSIALVAISGNDYARLANVNSTGKMIEFIEKVTTEIAKQVHRLRNNGASKILVNNLHPLGCTPWVTRSTNYTECSFKGNTGADIHNGNLLMKINTTVHDYILHVDVNKAFNNLVNPNSNAKNAMSASFKNKLAPCCESIDVNGYCGQKGDNGTELYTLCKNPGDYFFWDDVHPTEAGWKAVMKQVEGPIKKFLGLH
ncbi:GDSL esterase/lipase At5g03610-like [Oryza brachyantha]|uniref:GDSL esterase/lipase n=1 Tax=Oryza brachyantha TaxID=4533 RepID=J3M228_ORYBR|nr:GDSL esterase/lipase At5g03610-like [Oryza brachyantha]